MNQSQNLTEYFKNNSADDALAELQEQLKIIDNNHRADSADRQPIRRLMELMVSFTQGRYGSDLASPFATVYQALDALDKGSTPAILQSMKRRGRAQDHGAREEIKAFSAALVDLFQDKGCDLKMALGKTARLLDKNGVKVSKDGSKFPPTAVTVDNWRQSVEWDPKIQERRLNYKSLLENLPIKYIEKAANNLLEQLNLV